MLKVIDLSQKVTNNNPVFPGDPRVVFKSHHTHEGVGYKVSAVEMGTHTGTHIDVPLHKIPNTQAVDSIPLNKTMGKAYIADFTNLEPKQEITSNDLAEHEEAMGDCEIIIIKTGWSTHYGVEDFFSGFNGLTEDAAQWLVQKSMYMVALESPSVHPIKHAEVHEILLKNGVLVVETICNLDAVSKDIVQFFAAPLKLEGLDGSPVRAFAIENGLCD